MLKKLLLAVCLLLAIGSVSAGKMVLLEEAAEFETINIRVSNKGHGKFQLKRCDDCAEQKLTISPATTLEVAGKSLPLAALNRMTLRNGTVFFRADSGLVTRIEAAR